MRQKIVAGNWKMHGGLQKNAELLEGILSGISDISCKVVVFPPFPFLGQVADALKGTQVALGAQTVSEFPSGAYTGETAVSMLSEFGCRYVLVGHSERRSLFGETDEVVAKKFGAVQAAGLVPVLCIGESLQEREAGVTEIVVWRQVMSVIEAYGVAALSSAVLAYEPVWAIGTGLTATPEQAQEVHQTIRQNIAGIDEVVANRLSILYGGSVKAQNAMQLFAQPDIDGGLIGGSSLVADEFLAICRAVH